MSRLDEIKNEYAKSEDCETLGELAAYLIFEKGSFDKMINEIAEKYATECVKASLERASRIAKTYKSGNSGSYYDASVDKLSITQESNITLL